ncbi:MAG: hypothetical protein Q7T54_04885 [Candidatus Levybacteria bacterium]|nr:hypothetical protein [Candidatus Levybacteria bacterium]
MITEARPYLPTPKEASSWQDLRKNASINGAHDALIPQEYAGVTKSAPFAFDLGRENQLAQEYGKNYQQYFLENAHYYAKESYGRVPISEYEHKIMAGKDGKPELVLGPENISARDSYLVPVLDKTKPEWYQRRSMGDVVWVENMEKMLENAEDGDTYVDFSPTEYNVDVEERKKWGYGYHSFVRLHKVVTEDGQKKLVSRAIRNYLDAPEQTALFEQLTGEVLDASQMLGRVERVNPNYSQAYVKALASRLYDSTPIERKIIPPSEYLQNIKSEEEMNIALKKIDAWLEVVYEMMERGEDTHDILKKFRGWENALRDYVNEKSSLEKFSKMSRQDMKVALYQESDQVKDLLERAYEPGTNGCGAGSGFSETERNMTSMTYESMTKTTEGACPEIKCKKCTWKANEREVDDITKGKLNKCPRCGWKP